MIETSASGCIETDLQTVWLAIVEPELVVQWSPDVDRLLDDGMDYPTLDQTYRWRFRSSIPGLTLYDTPRVIEPHRRYQIQGRMAGLAWQHGFTLSRQHRGTRVEIDLRMSCNWPLLGPWMESLYLQRAIDSQTQESLRRLTQFCQAIGIERSGERE